MKRLLVFALFVWPVIASAAPLLVISVDGLDHRYLANRDAEGLRIPHIRKMIETGQWAERGVLGVVPTITWPSHTTLLTGVTPAVHGILSNRLPSNEYPWSAHLLKARTLIDAAHAAGLRTAAVTWPVTVDAPLNFNLPEYFERRRGGAMDLRSIETRAVPAGLVTRIARAYPSFAQEWMDDRTRTLAVCYLLRQEHPDLLLVHLVDLDSEEHDNAPFTRESNAVLEYTDELIGQMLSAKPDSTNVVLVSDHGFERVNTVVNVAKLAADAHVDGITARGAILIAHSDRDLEFVQQLSNDPRNGIGRRIPADEIMRFAPDLRQEAGVFESADGVEFGGKASDSNVLSKPREIGNHGHWPTRYRAVYAALGPDIRPERLGELGMTEVAGRFAKILQIPFVPGPAQTAR